MEGGDVTIGIKNGPQFCVKQIRRKEHPVELTLGDDTILSLV